MADNNDSDWVGKLPENFQYLLESTPTDLQDNALVLYFSCKYMDRDELKRIFSSGERTMIDLELDRIGKLRFAFAQRVENSVLVQRMSRSRMAWRRYAKELCSSKPEREKMSLRLRDAPTASKQRYSYYLSLLDKVENWSISADPLPSTRSLEEDKGYGFEVNKITLKRGQGLGGLGSWFGRYHLNSYPVNDVLFNKGYSPLSDKCDKDTIRYFHFPANNMLWVEEAIARYFGEERGDYNYRKAKDYCKKSSNLLCREFWTAQQQGSINDPTHARHMRPSCSFISTEQEATDDSPATSSKNFVVFMPYIHWETDKRRRKMAEVTKDIAQKRRRDLLKEFPHLTEQREGMREIVEKVRIKYKGSVPTYYSARKIYPDTCERSPLGQYLLDVANLYDAMDIEPDVRILSEHLYPHKPENPPIHGRRTLDQSYHWKLENIGLRDEDQVVYRGTKAGSSLYRTTRVVMVDQLWLYVLDDNTIISFFPKRWGRNKPDSSGVHEGIQFRLEHLRPGEIQSVYDLALIIMNQCSAVFFDRTIHIDSRPQVLDIFANAIAHMSELKTITFENFWRTWQNVQLDNPQLTNVEEIEKLARIYLDVHPVTTAGTLIRESSDIIDELRMMARIFSQQLRVTKDFSKILQDFNEQEVFTTKELYEGLKRTLESLTSRQVDPYLDSDMQRIVPTTEEETTRLRKPIPESTLYRSRSLLEDIQIRTNELQDLVETTKEITDELKDLLDLKQQQAGIIEARLALALTNKSVTQGQAIMIFTIITIIFLPLSFMSSLFGMNARELSGPDGGIMSLRYQFKFMFPISLAVILVSLALAFNAWIRNLISFLASITWAAFMEYSSLRWLWNCCIRSHNARGLYQSKHELTAKIYDRRNRKENRRALQKARAQERSRRGGIPIEMGRSRGLSMGVRAGLHGMV